MRINVHSCKWFRQEDSFWDRGKSTIIDFTKFYLFEEIRSISIVPQTMLKPPVVYSTR